MALRTPFLGRWGLLATTVVMGIGLVATGIVSYIGARDASSSLIEARAFDLAQSLRRELHRAGVVDASALASILSDLAQQSVSYVAVLDGPGVVRVSAGTPAAAVDFQPPPLFGMGPRIAWWWVHDRVRAVAAGGLIGRGHIGLGGAGLGRMGSLGPGGIRGPGVMGMGPGGIGPGRAEGFGMMGRGLLLGRGDPYVIFEFEPESARAMITRALVTLLFSAAAAALLLAVALVAWRQTRRSERLGAQLTRDQQLKSLGQMSAVLSHELRNPLASLKGHAQLLLEKLEPSHAGRAGAERVIGEALRLEAVANQILDFARPGVLERRQESPAEVARAAIEAVGDSRVQLSADSAPAAWNLNRLRIEQLLINLIHNAAEASPPSSAVEVGVTGDERELTFIVRDHGPGLPPGEEARVFEPFYARRTRGTGLGLAIAKQIAEAHGGRIEGRTHPDGGALFRVMIPLSAEVSR